MMKRMRALDMPKFRRPLKNRTRIGESVYFSSHNLIYLKFILMWLGCISLDFVIGFRFELLWPVWLLVRHLYESFRVHAFSTSLHYSAFSVFFVCVTATSDLVCYLFIPIQVLVFLASTYVWMQFVYQSTERGICVPSLALWTVFLMFEYSMRYRFENATWYLTRSSWITAGLFPSTADNVSIGSASNSSAASLSPRFELYRPFAAHCIGFPVVTLGFRVKSFFSKWRMRIRREEVMRRNEFFEKLLADAVPASFEDRHHFISSPRRYLMLDQDTLDQECGCSDGPSDGVGSRCYATASSSCTTNGQPLAICSSVGQPASTSTTTGSQVNLTRRITQKMFNKSATSQRLQQNGQIYGSNSSPPSGSGLTSVVQRRNGVPAPSRAAGSLSDGVQSSTINEDSTSRSLISYSPHKLLYKLGRILIVARLLQLLAAIAYSALSACYRRLICPMSTVARRALFGGGAVVNSTVANSTADRVESDLTQLDSGWNLPLTNQQPPDDLISCSGDGSSHVGGPDESDKEERLSQYTTGSGVHQPIVSSAVCANSGPATTNKRKSRRARGRTPVIESSNDVQYSQFVAPHQNGFGSTPAEAKATIPPNNLCNGHNYPPGADAEKYFACNGNVEADVSSNNSRENHSTAAAKSTESRQLQKEKEILEISVEKLTSELKTTRSHVHELRTQLSQTQQNERIYKNELLQQRTKFDQLEARHKHLLKQGDQTKALVAGYEKRVSDLQARKTELEQELANEQRLAANAMSAKEKHGNFAHMKSKMQDLEREMKNLRRQINVKDEEREKIVAELYELRCSNFTQQNEGKSLWERVSALIERNAFLEKTLSSENRLKQDLFQALNNSKAEIALLKDRLQGFKSNGVDLGNNGNGAFDGGLNGGVGLLDFACQPDDFHKFNAVSSHDQSQFGVLAQRQNSSPLACGTVLRPVSPIAIANLEQLMQATGAQHMSYSFAPYESTDKDGAELVHSPKQASETLRNGGSTKVATNNCAVGSSRKISAVKSGNNKKSSTPHRNGSEADNNGDAKSGLSESLDEINSNNILNLSLPPKQKAQQSACKVQQKSSVTIAN